MARSDVTTSNLEDDSPPVPADGTVGLVRGRGEVAALPSARLRSAVETDAEADARDRLWESEERYRSLIDSLPDPILRMDLNGVISMTNEAYRRHLGRVDEDLSGLSFVPLIDENDLSSTREAIARVQRPPYRETVENRSRTTTGWRWFEWGATGLRDAQGVVTEIQCVGRDVTERKKAEEALRASEENYRTIFNAAEEAIFVHDVETGAILDVNDRVAELMGYTREEIREVSPEALCSGEPPYVAATAFEKIRQTLAGHPQTFEWHSKRKNGELFWSEVGLKRVRLGGCDRLVAVVRDISERKEAEEALRESEARARGLVESQHRALEGLRQSEEKLRRLSQRQVTVREQERKRLGFNLHDDVCQELVGVGIMVESIRHRVGPTSVQTSGDFDRVVGYLNAMVEHLRKLARELQPMQLRELGLEDSLQSLAAGLSSNTCRVLATFSTGIPRLEEEVEVGVYRIAQEALANALRHSSARTIALALSIEETDLCLEITDDGRGFDPDETIGSLGLVSMEERALALGGTLEVRSALGSGTTIRLACPIRLPSQASVA